ncbi:MAG: UDP-N-acetylmuramate--L-alanine ligase [Planctomycetota bacterium]|jgi:UDP-N-acetylmuramate--alanine ligase|nr:UDP-N-acetylmuramate--L-alanine ligase [Planctomycetota bacterium]
MNSGPFRDRHVHLMGVGGAGVSALVPLLRTAGARVSGCDLAHGGTVRRLGEEGVAVALGHDPEHIDSGNVDLLVHSSAVPGDHAELRAARRRGVKILSRPACLAELMRGSRTVSVAGSHGKTTTAWMIGHLLIGCGADPVVMVGGSVPELGMSGARVGGSSLFVAEVDESDGGFAHVEPDVAVVTNLESEHLRHYGSFAALCETFRTWLDGIGPSGVLVEPASGLDVRVTEGLTCARISCGIEQGMIHAFDCAYGAEGTRCRISEHGADLGEVLVPLPGRHMVENAVMAIAAARHVDERVTPSGLSNCSRVRRRFTVHGEQRGVRVVEDYAHHPTELRATIAAAALAGGAVHVLFQPHRYTRSADCFHDFVAACDQAASVAVLPVYAAGEEPIAGVGGRDLAEAIAGGRSDRSSAQYAPHPAEGIAFLAARAHAGDTILVLGAGDVGTHSAEVLQALHEAEV